ncbi:hypothetical protein D3C73_1252080 [compost metagenome]
MADGNAWDLALYCGIKGRNRNAAVGNAFQQGGGIGIAPLGQNNAVVLLADRLINEILELGVVTVGQEGIDLETQFAAFLHRPGDKLRGIVV